MYCNAKGMIRWDRRSCLEVFTRKQLCESLFFNKVAGLRPATLLKKRLWHKCFPINFVKFLRTPFYKEHLFTKNTSDGCFCWESGSTSKICSFRIIIIISNFRIIIIIINIKFSLGLVFLAFLGYKGFFEWLSNHFCLWLATYWLSTLLDLFILIQLMFFKFLLWINYYETWTFNI